MDSNRLGGNPARRDGQVNDEPEEQVSRELMEEYMLKAPQQVRVGVAS